MVGAALFHGEVWALEVRTKDARTRTGRRPAAGQDSQRVQHPVDGRRCDGRDDRRDPRKQQGSRHHSMGGRIGFVETVPGSTMDVDVHESRTDQAATSVDAHDVMCEGGVGHDIADACAIDDHGGTRYHAVR